MLGVHVEDTTFANDLVVFISDTCFCRPEQSFDSLDTSAFSLLFFTWYSVKSKPSRHFNCELVVFRNVSQPEACVSRLFLNFSSSEVRDAFFYFKLDTVLSRLWIFLVSVICVSSSLLTLWRRLCTTERNSINEVLGNSDVPCFDLSNTSDR